ncbi:ABC transporter substrate-binding protein [Arthrobacter sp. Marseille-P9274]|uniref:ABC transporter substrate-binding protein n=1 Tax=Arthrobacter sp. Marseille-P9274 TaxID=2866572 RepID=UPI0021C8FA55|nr:ABC transporter substrate-binding protein [Arthrobacter sp. Marseille-P9274]
MEVPGTRGRLLKATAALAGIALLAACGGGSEASAGGAGGIASDIKLKGVYDTTGPVAYAGVGASKGMQLAMEEIDEQDFLGKDVRLSLEEVDTANAIERASSEVSRAIADPEVQAIFGPVSGQQAATVAPIVEQAKVPTIFNQAGSDGVVIGDYTFRGTAPMYSYYDIAAKYLADKGLTNVAVLYNATFPTFAEIGEKEFPKLAEEHGLTIASSYAVQSNTQDFTAQAQEIAAKDPDAVVMLLIAPQSVTALTQLSQAGYEGQTVASSVQAAGNVAQAGRHAAGLVYPVDFSATQESELAVKFIEGFKEKYGKAPDQYAAEGYDSMWWLARAIKASGDSSREGIQKGLKQVASEGFEGVMGDLSFEGNDIRVNGVLVEWDGSKEQLVTE